MKTIKYKKNRYFNKIFYILNISHIRLSIVIIITSLISLILSFKLENKGMHFTASIFTNVFAGLLTGFVIFLLSGIKQITIIKLNNKRNWLLQINKSINEYLELYKTLLSEPFEKYNGSPELFDFIYSVGTHANTVNDIVLLSNYNKTLLFNPRNYCKVNFNYDAYKLTEIYEDLHIKLQMIDMEFPTKKEIIGYFDNVDKELKKLTISLPVDINEIELKLNIINRSII